MIKPTLSSWAGVATSVVLLVCLASPSARAAISWDAEAGTPWWFNPVNWSVNNNVNNLLPPNGGSAFDAQINIGTGAWDLGEGVVYDPANDPHFAAAAALSYPPNRGRQVIDQVYISRNTTNHNLLTVKGDLTSMANIIVGRSGSIADPQNPGQFIQNLGRLNQLGGNLLIPSNVLDVGQREASGWGNGIYDYRGGILEVSLSNGNGIRLSAGGSAGPGGHGRFIMHNPATPGYVRAFIFNVAANAGQPTINADGVITGVGIAEFHYENGGTRPIQVSNQLILNNGMVTNGIRSPRLELVLDAPVTVDGGGVPVNLGLFDVDFAFDPINSELFTGTIEGDGTNGDFFSSASGDTLYGEGAEVSAIFGSTIYKWNISYTGDITWDDPNTSDVGVVSGAGTGTDVVLIGLSSVISAADDADFDQDLDIDGNDFLIWQRGLGVGTNNNTGDANNSGGVDAADLAVWKSQYGNPLPVTAAIGAVPEPQTLILLGLCVAAGIAGRRRIL